MLKSPAALSTGILGRIRPHWWRYAIALAVVAAAVAIRTLVDPVMGKQYAVVFLGAILIGAWVGGRGPALFCMVLLHLVHGYWFQDPPGLLDPTNTMSSLVSLMLVLCDSHYRRPP